MDQRLQEILKRYEQGTASHQEKKLIDEWFASFDDSQPVDLLQQPAEKERLKAELFSHVMQATRPAVVVPLKRWFNIAAAIVFLLMSSALAIWVLRSPTQPLLSAVTTVGEMKKIALADGSEVWLNAKGKLRYPEKFDARTRDIYLDEGEAFFKVRHLAGQPFIVHIGHFQVQVLGTSFNVQAYHQLNSFNVAVSTGKVSVSTNGRLLHQLTMGQELVTDMNGNTLTMLNHQAVDADSWTQGEVELQNAAFAELALRINNAYGVNLTMHNKAHTNSHYTLQLDLKAPLENNLDIICKIHHLKYRRNQREVIIY